jgi:hypothetical protein
MKAAWVVVLLAFSSACNKGEKPRAPSSAGHPLAASEKTVASPTASGIPSTIADSIVLGAGGGSTLLPDSEPAGAPFASTIAAAVAEVTQAGPVYTSRIYRAAYEQARQEITPDNARKRLRALEREIDLERQSLP